LPPFANELDLAHLVDRVARRYSITPADVLSMDPEDLGICLVCMCAADHSRRDMVKQVQRQSGKSMIPFPVPTIDLGDL
jgi:hypothetical protein